MENVEPVFGRIKEGTRLPAASSRNSLEDRRTGSLQSLKSRDRPQHCSSSAASGLPTAVPQQHHFDSPT